MPHCISEFMKECIKDRFRESGYNMRSKVISDFKEIVRTECPCKPESLASPERVQLSQKEQDKSAPRLTVSDKDGAYAKSI